MVAFMQKERFCRRETRFGQCFQCSQELLIFLKALKLERGSEEFVPPHLKQWTRGEGAKVIKQFCKSINITPIRFHDLRATFITNLLARAESLARVMALVGHSRHGNDQCVSS